MAKRTTHRSTAGKKLYAVRDAEGKFKDIQTYERAHRADLKKTSQAEATKAARTTKATKATKATTTAKTAKTAKTARKKAR